MTKKQVILSSIIAILIIVFIGISLFSIFKTNHERENIIAKENFVADSIAREKYIQDSIETAKKHEVTIKECEPFFEKEYDEFKNTTWVYPKDKSKYEHCYCYFQIHDDKVQNFRFLFRYYAENWIFIKYLIFNFDGKNITIYPEQIQRDVLYGGHIKEWFDISVKEDYLFNDVEKYRIDESFIKRFLEADTVKVAIYGEKRRAITTFSSEEIESIRQSYNYYVAIGGKFEY